MKKETNKIITLIFCIFIYVFLMLNILVPDREFSESENRVLAKIPKLNIKNLASGKFTRDFEIYISDQLVFKDYLVFLKSDVERLSLKKENNGVFFGEDGYLLERFQKPDKTVQNNIELINYFINKVPNISTYVLLVPNSVKIYEDKLPLFAENYDQLEIINSLKKNLNTNGNFIDVYGILNNKKDEYIYFRTDHHWTMRGAYYGYREFCSDVGITPYELDDFHIETVSDNFYGTFYSKANNRNIDSDRIELFTPKFQVKFKVNYSDKDKVSDSLYESKYLEKRDQYAMFLAGNHPLIKIKSSIDNGKKIVIFKDSYANAFIPFLTNHYEEIHVIDLRYYKLNIYDYIENNHINEAMFLYNVSTFSTDTNLIWLNR